MKPADGATVPIWMQAITLPQHLSPPVGLEVEICVVGAGIAGLTTAYLLAGEGRDVVVVDEGAIGQGQSNRTSAHLASVIDDRFMHVEKQLGEQAAKLAHESHAAAISRIEQIARDEEIECDFHRLNAYLFAGPDDTRETLEKELAAALRAGVVGAEMVESVSTGDATIGPAIRFPKQARYRPVHYLVGLARAAEKRGVRIFTGKRVNDVTGVDPNSGEPATVTFTDDTTLRAKHVVVATNTPAPINDWFGIYTKQHAYRTYMVGLTVPSRATPDALYWDTHDPYHYARLVHGIGPGGADVLIVGGEDHKVGHPGPGEERFAALEQWTRKHFPQAREVVSRWSGQVQEPLDGLGFIGRAVHKRENVYVITGDSGMGLTHGTLGAMIITDLIAGRANAWADLYDPQRKQTTAEFVTENVDTALQYKDYLTGGDIKSEDELLPNTGGLMREGIKKVAVYKDDAGRVHKCSPVCTHLGCIVHWNDVEKTWDCPCHGGRYDPKGKVLMGPPVADLSPVEE